MGFNTHNILVIRDENDADSVGDFIETLAIKSENDREAKMHLLFIDQAFSLLSNQPIETLVNNRTTMTITIDGQKRTKSYTLVKPLRVVPIYELRYALDGNEHIRFLFFPFVYEGQSNYIFVKCFKKTRIPPVDETDVMRDLAYQMYLKIRRNPQIYL